MIADISIEAFQARMDERGWVVFPNVLAAAFVEELRRDCLKWVEICKAYQIRNGIHGEGDGTAHHCLGAGDSIDRYIDMHLFHEYLSAYFDGAPYICNSLTPLGGFPQQLNYVHDIHRDVRTFIPGYNLKLNMLVMCDAFTETNGTLVLSGSHVLTDKPSEQEFDARCERIVGSPGSVMLFNSLLWHRGGHIRGHRNRVALTVGYGRAFVKPHMDYARMLGEEYGRRLSPLTRQVLGYNSMVPVSLDEWYKPVSERLYRADQG
jgi:ectoine hydroxylase-related dioxygenase (phytanoyl-CoA dioxygenase family)